MTFSSKEKAREWYQKNREKILAARKPEDPIKKRNRERQRVAKKNGFNSWEEYQQAKSAELQKQKEIKQQRQNEKEHTATLIAHFKSKGQRPPWDIVGWDYKTYVNWLNKMGA